jgi:putative tricarboxylic transport membrane protein
MRNAIVVHDLILLTFSGLVCLGGLKLGFGSFQDPSAGFMPFLAGMLLGILSIIDLISGFVGHGKSDKATAEIWTNADWPKLISTISMLLIYTVTFTTLGFLLGTILLLLFLFRVMEPRRWRIVLSASVVTAGLSYLVFKIGLDTQLPKGFLGF